MAFICRLLYSAGEKASSSSGTPFGNSAASISRSISSFPQPAPGVEGDVTALRAAIFEAIKEKVKEPGVVCVVDLKEVAGDDCRVARVLVGVV